VEESKKGDGQIPPVTGGIKEVLQHAKLRIGLNTHLPNEYLQRVPVTHAKGSIETGTSRPRGDNERDVNYHTESLLNAEGGSTVYDRNGNDTINSGATKIRRASVNIIRNETTIDGSGKNARNFRPSVFSLQAKSCNALAGFICSYDVRGEFLENFV